MGQLRFSPANDKIKKLQKKTGKRAYSLDLLAGHTCPFAKDCKSTVTETKTGKRKITDGPDCEFRCYAASGEIRLPEVYALHKANTRLLKSRRSIAGIVSLFLASLPKNAEIIRLHASGDIFSEKYFLALIEIAKAKPNIVFYGYTKAIPFLAKYRDVIPANLKLVASFGGTHDHLIRDMISVTVVYSRYEARKRRLAVDQDDSHAYRCDKNFAILIHGVQPANSKAMRAVQRIKMQKAKAA
jgi:hypothetical protein